MKETNNTEKTISIRLDEDMRKMLSEINVKPGTASQTAVEVLLWLRRATIHELKGRFSHDEIVGMAGSFNRLTPTWQIMCNPTVLAAHMEDAEKYKCSISCNGADPDALIDKLETLTAAQATILQLELWSFWNRDNKTQPDLNSLIKTLS